MPAHSTPLSIIIRRYLPHISLSVVVDVMSNLSYSLIPALTAILIDRVLVGGDLRLSKVAVAYAVLLLCYLALGYLSQVIAWSYVVGFEKDAKNAYFSAVVRDRGTGGGKESGAILSHLTNNVTKIEQDFLTPCVAIAKDSAALLLYATVLFVVSTPTITTTLFVASICLLFLPRLVRTPLSEKANSYLEALSTYTSRAEELIRARSDIPSQCRNAIGDEHRGKAHNVAVSRKKWGILKASSDVLAGTGTEVLLLVAFVVAGLSAISGEISIGVVAATIGYSQAFLSPLEDMLYCFNAINSTANVRKRFNTDITSSQSTTPETTQSSSDVMNVSASNLPTRPEQAPGWKDYPRVDIELSHGGKLYLRGASGSGKTTLMRAISFGISVDGASIYSGQSSVDYDSGWNPFAYVGLTSPVFHASFVENVTLFGAFRWDEETLKKLSGDTGFLERLRDRKDMAEASGGEKQFMLLARATLHKPAFYILDEPTSAMDKDTQEHMLNYFASIPEGVILSTHQESAIPKFDRWKVLDLNALN